MCKKAELTTTQDKIQPKIQTLRESTSSFQSKDFFESNKSITFSFLIKRTSFSKGE